MGGSCLCLCSRSLCAVDVCSSKNEAHTHAQKREINYTRSRVSIELNALMVPCNDKVVRQIDRAGNAGAQQPWHRHLSRMVVRWWQWLLRMQSSTNLVGRTTIQDDHKHRQQNTKRTAYIFISPFYNFLLKVSVLASRKRSMFYSSEAKCRCRRRHKETFSSIYSSIRNRMRRFCVCLTSHILCAWRIYSDYYCWDVLWLVIVVDAKTYHWNDV